jgi:hypothetical protein
LICRFWLRISAQENPYKYLWATKTTLKWYSWECPGESRDSGSELSKHKVRSIWTYTRSLRVTIHHQ